MTLPVKPINEIEEKAQVGADDKILILDADTEEARLASKDELKGDKGDQGDPGTPGADGKDGKDGKDGTDGAAATITVGTTSTGAAGSSASVTNSGTSSAAVLNFTIPKGDKGDTGPAGADGKDGQDGQNGQDGQDGADGNGITSVTSSKVGKTTTVTMNFDEGDPFSFEVEDGADGQGAGNVIGPNSSTDGDVVLFDGTTGKLIKDSGVQLGTAASKDTGTSSGNVPVLDSNGKLNTSTLPGVALTDTFTVANKSDLTSLSNADQGDIGIVTSESKTYVLSQAPYSTAGNWKELLSPTDAVTSVNSKTGAVTLNADDISDSTTTNKFVTATDKTTWGNKQDALTLPGSPTSGHLVTWGANNKTLADGGAIPTGLPAGGTTGQVVKKTADGAEWANESGAVTSVNNQTGAVTVTEFLPSGTPSTGDVVTKTAVGYEWAAPSGGDAKVFEIANLTSAENLAIATQAYAYAYTTGKCAIIRYSGYNYVYANGGSGGATFTSSWGNGAVSSGNWATIRTLKLTVSSGSVTAITSNTNYINISSSAPSSSTTNGTITLVI